MSTSLVAKIPGSVLDKIADRRRLDVTAAQAVVTEDELRAQIAAQSPAGDFVAALQAAASHHQKYSMQHGEPVS